MGWTSPALPVLQSTESELWVTPEQGSWLGCLVNLGALLGAAPAGIIAQNIGRQRFLTVLALPLLASWLLIAFGKSVSILYAGRFLGGLAAGAISVTAPVYTAEIAEQKCRGALGTLFQLQLTMGILFVYGLGVIAPLICLALTCAIVPTLYFITFLWMPETPQFLLSRGQKIAAERSLQWLRGNNCDIKKELLSMQSAVQQAEADTVSHKETLKMLVTEIATRKALIIAFGLMIFQQLSGINAVIFYSGSIFSAAGGAISPAIASLIIGVVQVIATLCGTMMVDRAGRRPLLLISSTVMSICLAGLATSYAMPTENRAAWLDWLPLLSVAIFIVVFSIGFGPIPWLMMGELFSPSSKSAASAITASLNWFLAFIVTKSFQNMLQIMGSTAAFGFFSAICMAGTIFVALVVPETKGKSLEDIQIELAGPRINISLNPI
jgi:sugar porter (SP) family MFS transporter